MMIVVKELISSRRVVRDILVNENHIQCIKPIEGLEHWSAIYLTSGMVLEVANTHDFFRLEFRK